MRLATVFSTVIYIYFIFEQLECRFVDTPILFRRIKLNEFSLVILNQKNTGILTRVPVVKIICS
jgi:hypothetical protein